MTSSTGNSPGSPPHDAEVEVSLFGPGYGESVLVHLGQQDWLVVDSCINQPSKQSAPLAYLRSIGVDPSVAVKLVVATHWHDDHVRGLGSVLHTCKAAQFVCSDALRSHEFLTLVAASRQAMMASSGMREFAEIVTVLQERRGTSSKRRVSTPMWAIENRLLLQRSPENGLPYQVHALSPSDAAITLARHELARLLPSEGKGKLRVASQSPNHVAVVLWVKVGRATVLLGSDLEETTDTGTGWSVIVDSITRPSDRACVFKIPHHGSVTADQPRVWSEMLRSDPYAVITPFWQGKVSLPTDADTNRICSRTPKAYATAGARPKRSRRAGVVEKTIRETVRDIREVPSSTGHVRLRTNALESAEEAWKVELFGTALPLRQLA